MRKLLGMAGMAILWGSALGIPAAQGGWSVGVRFHVPVGGYHHHWHPYGHYGYHYRPYPVYVAPPPVYVAPPVVLQPAPVVQPVYPAPTYAPAPRPTAQPVAPATNPAPAQVASSGEAARLLALLADPDEKVRADAAVQLGRLKASQAVDPLAATLAGDRSPVVREAAARALALIGSSRGLAALKRAALADADRDVRHSAQFAIDVIQTGR
jgi:hypothetical protein